ncbi:hypothetical protein QQ045_019820 [Rhodiola kirilowii]
MFGLMGLSKFLSSLKLSKLAIPRIPRHRPRTSASIIFLRSFRFSIPSNGSVPMAMPIHGGLTETLVGTGISETPADNIARDVETLCKIASNQSISNMEVSLGQVSVRVSPLLVKEVLKKLSNGGVIALTFFRWAEKQKGYQHDNESYNLLIDSLGKIKQFKMIWGLVGDMRRRKLLSKDTFYLIMRRYARARKVKETLEAFEKMKEFGLEHDDVLDFNKLLDVLCKAKHVEQAQELFDEMSNRRFKPDVRSYTILLEGWGHVQNMLRLNEVYREMKAEGLEPDVVTYGIMINVYSGRTKEAYAIFQKMSTRVGCKPSSSTYEIIVRMLCNEDQVDMALRVWHEMRAKGVIPGIHMYSALINTLCQLHKLDDASKYFLEMLDMGLRPLAQMFSNLKQALLDAGRKDTALMLALKLDKLRKTRSLG